MFYFRKRVFVIGPAHYVGIKGYCALSIADAFNTPLYQLPVDKEGKQIINYSSNSYQAAK